MSKQRSFRGTLARALYGMVHRVLPAIYAQDGLISVHTHEFMDDPEFVRAYARGVQAIGGSDTYQWHWRVHVGLWAARIGCRLDGDFVECGVNRGFMSSAIMEYLDWNSRNKDFYLLDTFTGLDQRFLSQTKSGSASAKKNAADLKSGFYVSGAAGVRANFAEWPRARIVEGSVPDTLEAITSTHVAYLHLDMNSASPEVAAIEHLWSRIVPGAPILLDDYAYLGFTPQKRAMDTFAQAHGVYVCSLPTGQGLIIKTPDGP